MKLIVVRHALTDWNTMKRWHGHTDVPLSAEGRVQAKKLALRLKEYTIEIIYSSPLSRALDTAKAIKEFHPKAKIVQDNDLMEIAFGVFEGLTLDEVILKHKEIFEEREKDKYNYKGHRGESLREVEERGLRALDRVISAGKDCVIVSHGVLNHFILKKLLNTSIEEIKKHNYGNTNISVFEINDGSVTVKEFNCTKHLNE